MGFATKNILLGVAVAGTLVLSRLAYGVVTDATSLIASGGTNELLDPGGANLIKGTDNTNAGIIEVGDYLYGVSEYVRIVNVNYPAPGTAIGAGTSTSELTGVFLVEVLTKNPDGNGTYDFTFGPDTAKYASVFGVAVPAGTVMTLYDDPRQDVTLGGSVAASLATAMDGTLAGHLGFTGPGGTAAGGEGWASAFPSSDDFGILPSEPTTFTIGTTNFAISRTDTEGFFGALPLAPLVSGFGAPLSTAECTGFSEFEGSLGSGDAWDGLSRTSLSFAVAAPEPASLSLLALGGLGLLVRRRR
jgi:hypothetical protein